MSPVTERPIFALIIGINEYQDNGATTLRGCVNDSRMIFNCLKDTLHVPDSNIVLLNNGQATRQKILDTFESHFIKNPVITSGDAIVFYFAGHGSRQKAPDGWHSEDMRVEIICPYDVGDAYGIPDYTLTHLLRQLAFYKGNNITLIFDSCHSGGMGRIEVKTVESTPLTRCYNPPDGLPALPADLDRRIWSWSPDSERASYLTKPELPGSLYKAMQTHVLLAACQPRQRAREVKNDAEWSGAFTSALIDSLRSWNPLATPMTYLRLMEGLPPLDGQHPHCEGTNRVRRLFSPSDHEKDDPSWFVVTEADNAYYVAAGYLLGVVRGTEFITHPPKDVTPITLTATHVEECRCRVVARDIDSRLPSPSILPHHSRATVFKWRTKWLQVELEPRDAFPHIIEDDDALFSVVESSGQLKASRANNMSRTVQLIRKDPLISSQPECQSISIDLNKFTRDYLDKVASFHFFLYQHNKSSRLYRTIRTSDLPSVTVSLQRLDVIPNLTGPPISIPAGDNLFRLPAHEDDIGTAIAGAAVLEGPAANLFYALTLENHASVDLFPYVFFFDPRKYTIEPVYLPQSPISRPLTRCGTDGSTLGIGYGAQGTDKMCFSLPEGLDYDSGFFKVFVSAIYINMKAILPTSERHMVPWANSGLVDRCWDSWVYLVTVRR